MNMIIAGLHGFPRNWDQEIFVPYSPSPPNLESTHKLESELWQ